MTQIDQFESVFKAAARTPFEDLARTWKHWLFISDRDADFTQKLGDQTAHFLSIVCHQRSVLTQNDYQGLGDLLEKVKALAPDLILTYRNLKSDNWKWPYSLGSYLDVLTQATDIPVLVLPHPDPSGNLAFPETDCRDVMVVTNHLTGDNALVSAALDFTPADGNLWLTHIEEQHHFERFMSIIGKIPQIETGQARDLIRARLLKEPSDYIESVKAHLLAQGKAIKIESWVGMGHRLSEYKGLIETHNIDLLIMNTKDDDQLAMAGMAYPLAVELTQIPILML